MADKLILLEQISNLTISEVMIEENSFNDQINKGGKGWYNGFIIT